MPEQGMELRECSLVVFQLSPPTPFLFTKSFPKCNIIWRLIG